MLASLQYEPADDSLAALNISACMCASQVHACVLVRWRVLLSSCQ